MPDITIYTGPTGTELQRRGFKTELPLWSAKANLEAPELLEQIHEDYVLAGAEVISTNTFRTNPRTWKKIGKEEMSEVSNKAAVNIALKVKKRHPRIKVAGSITTLEDCYRPDLVPSDKELNIEHEIQVERFRNVGVDLMLLETLNSLREAEVLLKFASRLGLPVWLSFVTDQKGDILSGEKLEKAVKLAEKYNVEAFLLNCRAPKTITIAAKKLAKMYQGKKGAYGNGSGHPADDLGWEFDDACPPSDYLKYVDEWVELGFEIIGGCCGTSPEYIKLIAAKYS